MGSYTRAGLSAARVRVGVSMVMLSSIDCVVRSGRRQTPGGTGFEIRCCAIWADWFTVWHTLSKFSAHGRRNDTAKAAVGSRRAEVKPASIGGVAGCARWHTSIRFDAVEALGFGVESWCGRFLPRFEVSGFSELLAVARSCLEGLG